VKILIIVLLFILSGVIFIAWLFGFFPPSTPEPKYRSCDFKLDQLPSNSRESPFVLTPKAASQSQKIRLPRNAKKHLANIKYAKYVLQRLRAITPEAKLPTVIATLRRISPDVFEELVLTCCKEQGWQIQRNFRYTDDGGIDGRVLILGKLYVIQVKRYGNYIKAQHIQDFLSCIEYEKASGGFFVHTGKTGALSKQLLRDYRKITLVSGRKLVNFVLGKQVKIVGITL